MKKTLCLMLALLMLLSLAACGQTTAAPAAAPCEHSYGPWIPGGEGMIRTCSLCSTEENAPLDHHAVLNSQLQGAWDLESVTLGDTVVDAYSTQDMRIASVFVRFFGEATEEYACSAQFVENGSHFDDNEVARFSTWEKKGDTFSYWFTIGISRFSLDFSADGESILRCHYRSNGVNCSYNLTRNDELEDFAIGLWYAVYPSWSELDGIDNFKLNADRSVSRAGDDSFQGFWSLRPLVRDEESGKYKFGIVIIGWSDEFHRGYNPMNGGEIIWVGDSPEELSSLKKEEIRLHMNHDDEILDLFPAGLMDDEPEKYSSTVSRPYPIEGKWRSSLMSGVGLLYTGIIEAHPELPVENRAHCYFNDCSLEILPDGSFTANLREGELHGTWEKRDAPENLQQHLAAAFFEQMEYYTLTSSSGEEYYAELYCFGNSAALNLSLLNGPAPMSVFDRLSPLKYVFTKAID